MQNISRHNRDQTKHTQTQCNMEVSRKTNPIKLLPNEVLIVYQYNQSDMTHLKIMMVGIHNCQMSQYPFGHIDTILNRNGLNMKVCINK